MDEDGISKGEEIIILNASRVYLLMSKEYRISRNRRSEWFFSHLNSTITIKQKYKLDEYSEEIEIVSIIPKDPPPSWSIGASHLFRYVVSSETIVEFLSRKYRFVYCLDMSPSAGSVDIQTGMVILDGIFGVLQNSMEGLVKPFYVPGSYFIFQPKIYVTVLAHAPFLSSLLDEVIIQGVLLDSSTCKHVLQTIFRKLGEVENKLSELLATVSSESQEAVQVSSEEVKAAGNPEDASSISSSSLAMSPDFGLVDLLRHALIALHLLPENSGSGLIVLTDGVISVPDGGYLDMVLSQLRYNAVSCSFIQLSSPFHPHTCHGILPYADLMRFISTATFGAFLSTVPKIEIDSQAMNIYHKSFLTLSFQDSVESFKNSLFTPLGNKPGEWSVQNKCFSTIRDMPIVKKQQYETSMNVDYMKVLSCRLREGFCVKETRLGKDNLLHIKLVLPWKFLILIEYILITHWPPPLQPKVSCVVSLEAPYDFLHDVTCLAKKPFQSYYRQLLVNKFWASQKHLSESDKLLVHFNSFCSNSVFYNIPESLKNGLPLFYISSNTSAPSFQSSEFAFPQFSQFWKPVCLLDTDIWQKWMHTHRIGVVLEHDHPIPKHIHLPNPSGRFHVIQCRQTMMALNTLLKDWSSFVLVENHSYIRLMFKEKDKPPYSFCIIRVTTKPPCVILRLAFLVGTPGDLRHRSISELCERIAGLTFPQRLNEPPKWRVPSGNSISASSRAYKRTWSDMPCCVLLYKPIEKILIRYEEIPRDFAKTLLPQHSYNSWTSSRKTTSNQSTFGFRPTYSTPWGSHVNMGPEMFNAVARYLHHRRWIWCVQNTPSYPLNMECVDRILSTITKMRLQEGLRFAYSSCGIVNMIMEMELKNEKLGVVNPDIESIDNVEDYERSTSVLQYVMFPPVTTLVSNIDEDDEDREEDFETSEENSDLFLITECWIEPQVGDILSSTENTSFNGLKYEEVPMKMFDTDQECISSLVTFEHLSLMCQSSNVPSPSELLPRQNEKPYDSIDANIKYIPFSCELKRILTKCQQSELLFSMFNQDLSMSFPVVRDSDISSFCDRANSILFEAWVTNVAQMHDREVLLDSDEHMTLFEHITRRQRAITIGEAPMAGIRLEDLRSCPKWRCFIKGLSSSHFLLTILPASYYDLKLLMLSPRNLNKEFENKAVFLLPTDDLNDSNLTQERSFMFSPQPQPPLNLTPESAELEAANDGMMELGRVDPMKPFDSSVSSRKRSRVKSGGESGPLPKRSLNRKSSLDNLFRCRTNSVEAAWKNRMGKNTTATKDPDDSSFILSPRTESELNDSQFSFENQSRSHRLFPPNHQAKYGSITLPIYVYDCSLATLTEHIIFRTFSGQDDIYTDCRVCSPDENFSYPSVPAKLPKSPSKHFSPEPKSEEQEFPPSNGETLQNHCHMLEVAFAKSYVHGLFESLQAGNYVHKKDIQESIRLCRETKIEINLSEYIQTICRHFKEMKVRRTVGEEVDSDEPKCPPPSCDELKDIHAFIKRRFNHSILSTFHWVMDCAGIFYYKNSEQPKLESRMGDDFEAAGSVVVREVIQSHAKEKVLSLSNSSKNVSDVEEIESLVTVKADSLRSEVPIANGIAIEAMKSPEMELEDQILGPDFFTQDDSVAASTEDSGPVPLFFYLACTYYHGNVSGSFLVHDMPTCLEEIAEALGDSFEEGDPNEKIELFMEFVFLTVPPEVEEVDYRVANTMRISSTCSISRDREISFSRLFDKSGKAYPSLPFDQYHAIKSVVEDVKWLLKDEITSFRWETRPLTELALTLVACHVEKSLGKPGCQVTMIPLNFVNNPSQIGFEKFKERFSKSVIDGYELKELGTLFYLVPNLKPNNVNLPCDSNPSSILKAAATRTLDDQNYKNLSEEILKLSLENQIETVEFETEDTEIIELGERGKERRLRKTSGLEIGRNRLVNMDNMDGGDGVVKQDNYLTTPPSLLSEISSLVESTNEDGYEGDGSDSEEDCVKMDVAIQNRNLPPFWILCKLSQQQVVIYFHTRYDEDKTLLYEYLMTIRNQVVRLVRQLKRIVNQDILLQQMHETRQCSNLIEAKTHSLDYAEHELHYPPPLPNSRIEELDVELGEDPKQFPSGYFACDVVWETKFALHSRLRTGPGKSVVSRGIQTLQATLIAFEVVNRKNMFVYIDTSGNVFYLRLYRMEDKSFDLSTQEIEDIERLPSSSPKASINEKTMESNEFNKGTTPEKKNEDVILLRVHGITEAGHEIKENLVQSLRNKLDDAVLDILSVTLDRNPHCKLTSEDVAFIQKINSSPDTVLKYSINSYASQHLPAFAFYLNQNLLQIFCLPKYTELKPDFHFQDYSELGRENDHGSTSTMYLYNQRPGGTGSRGIACVAVSIVDATGKCFTRAEWSRPAGDAYTTPFSETDFEERVNTEEVVKNDSLPPSSLMVELRMWKQGRINLDLLKGFLSSAIRHSMWDLTMEFYFLTAPLSVENEENPQFSFSFSTPCTPKNVGIVPGKTLTSTEMLDSLSLIRRRNSIVLPNPIPGKGLETLETRIRSMSVNARKASGSQDGKIQGRASSPMAFPFPGQTFGKQRQQLDPLVVGLNRLEAGDIGQLHEHYKKFFTAWCEFGSKLNVPSLRMIPIDLAFRHPVDTVVIETEKLVQQIIPEYDPKQFWKIENESEEFMAGGLRIFSDSRVLMRKNMEAELKVLKSNLRRLENFFETEQLEYPEDLIPLFKEPEDFHPLQQGDECILMSRNLIHWKFCVGYIDPQFFSTEAYKSQYKFPPLISSGWDQPLLGSSYMSLEKISRAASASGLSCLMNEPDPNPHPILIPRQRLLLAKVTNSKIFFIFYNWSKETMDRLIDSTKVLALWINARSSLLSSISAQKSGLFHNQSITRSAHPPKGFETNPFTCGGAEVDSLLKYQNPPKEFSPSRPMVTKKPKSLKNLVPFLESFRNIKHQATAFKVPTVISDPFKAVEEQINQLKSFDKTETKNSIFQYWLSRGPSASNVIGSEGIQAFKQAARTLHYCLTPIIFLPRWRSEIALTRDNTHGIVRKYRNVLDTKQFGLQLKYDGGTDRSRHDSGTSQKSIESTITKSRSKSIWGLWNNSSSQSQDSQPSSANQSLTNLSLKKADEKWHIALCESFIQEYMQYLQTLGFISIHSRNSTAKKSPQGKPDILESERLRHISGASLLSSSSSQSGTSMGVTFNNFSRRVREDSGGDKIFYLQKSLPGGIILFEVGLCEPFFYAKIHTLEVTRIQSRKSWKGLTYQNVQEFVNQCERMKTLMHLHSFTYDFHLRSIHSYISGRQFPFKQGYHITNFLDDFIKYYPKGPNFARNTVYIGTLTVQNVTTPATILFNYMLEKLYHMKVIRMNVERSLENMYEYILVDMSSKKIVYKDKDDERQCDEFDLTLLIAHDSPPLLNPYSVDPSVLRLKYYIILTSRRELYPKVNEEIGDGKLCVVNTPEPLSIQRELKMYSGMSDTRTIRSRKASIDERGRGYDFSQPETDFYSSENTDSAFKQSYPGIKEESAHYMGYFSSHEQMMQQIVREQVDWVEVRIRDLVSTASVDCRRDLLWQRLLLGNEKQKNKKEDLISRETVGALTYWEFGELLELVHVQSLSDMDSRLACLLRQPVSFYQSLLKLIIQGSSHNFRYFAAHDKSTHHMALFSSNSENISPKSTKHIVVLEINLERRTSDLSVLFKDIQEIQDRSKLLELEVDILNLVESVVNICCYCWWWWSSTASQ